jgi:hypothetical protein
MNYETYEQLKKEFNTPEFKRYLKAVKGGKCLFCGSSERIEYHHIVPLAQGGDNRINNIVPLCQTCHLKAHNKKPIQGKMYKPKGRKQRPYTKAVENTLDRYFNDEISRKTAQKELHVAHSTFDRFKHRYMSEHNITDFRSHVGCSQWRRKH